MIYRVHAGLFTLEFVFLFVILNSLFICVSFQLQVHGKRFVYKFVCDLKQLLGYSAEELNNLVMQSSSAPRSHHH